jgi:uncharacterized protein
MNRPMQDGEKRGSSASPNRDSLTITLSLANNAGNGLSPSGRRSMMFFNRGRKSGRIFTRERVVRKKSKGTTSRGKKKSSGFWTGSRKIVLFLCVVAGGLLLAIAFLDRTQVHEGYPTIFQIPKKRTTPVKKSESAARSHPTRKTVKKSPPPDRPQKVGEPEVKTIANGVSTARGAIIIDDLGQQVEVAKELLELDTPIAFSILPSMSESGRIARLAAERGRIVMAHIPMETVRIDQMQESLPWLLVGMKATVIERTLDQIFTELPQARGANNHTGSRFTTYRPGMEIVLDYLKQKTLFFVDSRTTTETVGYNIARQKGIPCAERNIFFDDDDHAQAVTLQFDRFIDFAKKNGSVIGIGHPKAETLKILKEYLPKIQQAGVRLVPITEMLNPPLSAATTASLGK